MLLLGFHIRRAGDGARATTILRTAEKTPNSGRTVITIRSRHARRR